MPNKIDLTGKKFGRLIVLGLVQRERLYWKCRCECGNIKIIAGCSLSSGRTQSCGCLHKERTAQFSFKHGLIKTKFYKKWASMRNRCSNKKEWSYKNYGARNIHVCAEWKNFENFKNDMYESYLKHARKYGTKNTTIERINNDKGYYKKNCRWATVKEQCNNRRSNLSVTYGGKTKNLEQWRQILGIEYHTLYNRLYLYNWDIKKAFHTKTCLTHLTNKINN